MIPAGFEYHVPRSLPDALRLLSDLGSEAKVLAGGHSLLPMMKLRFSRPAHLIDLNRIDALRGIREEGAEVVIGAMTVEAAVLGSPVVRSRVPLLSEAVRLIADPQVRNRGTIGGDLAHGDPGNDHPALALALDATLVVEGPRGRRRIKADGFFHGLYYTELAADEILVEIRYPVPPAGTGYAYEKLKRKTGDFASAASAVLLRMKGGRVEDVRIALTNLAPTPLRVAAAEDFLRGKPLDEPAIGEAARLASAACDPAEDQRGNADYKRAMGGEMTRRALRKALSRAK